MIIINAGRLHSLAQRLLSTCNGRDRGTCLRVGVDARPFRVDRDEGFKRRIELNGAESCPRNIILCVSWDGLDVPLVSASEDGMRASERERERREGEREREREGERERGREGEGGRASIHTFPMVEAINPSASYSCDIRNSPSKSSPSIYSDTAA